MAKRIAVWAYAQHTDFHDDSFVDLPDNWDSMSDAEKKERLDKEARDYVFRCVRAGAYVIDGTTVHETHRTDDWNREQA